MMSSYGGGRDRFEGPCVLKKINRSEESFNQNDYDGQITHSHSVELFLKTIRLVETVHREQIVKRERENQQDATIRCLLSTVSTCFGHHYAHLQENKDGG